MKVEGKLKRMNRTFPTELVAPLIMESEALITKIRDLADEMGVLSSAAETLDGATFNFSMYNSTRGCMKQLYEVFDSLTYTIADHDINFLKIIKTDKHRINIYRQYNEDKIRQEELWSDKYKRAFGYEFYGHRYSRMPMDGDIRKRIFI